VSVMTAATASSPRPQRAARSSLLAMSLYVAVGSRLAGLVFFGGASHRARAIASARRAKTMNRDGSALRAIGRVHSLAHGSGTV
jgi:hypothetical protein